MYSADVLLITFSWVCAIVSIGQVACPEGLSNYEHLVARTLNFWVSIWSQCLSRLQGFKSFNLGDHTCHWKLHVIFDCGSQRSYVWSCRNWDSIWLGAIVDSAPQPTTPIPMHILRIKSYPVSHGDVHWTPVAQVLGPGTVRKPSVYEEFVKISFLLWGPPALEGVTPTLFMIITSWV